MGLFKKLLGGGIGFALGGPIGAIIGVVISSMFENDSNPQQQKTYSANTHAQQEFVSALLILIAAVLKADGKVVKAELSVVKGYLLNMFGEESAREALQILKGLIDRDVPIEQVTSQIRFQMNISQKRQLLYMLMHIAYADKHIDQQEIALIQKIAVQIGLTLNDFESTQAMFGSANDLSQAYKVLEISETATDAEVKKAYRSMAMKYHPDKVASLGEEVHKSAHEQFKKINDAYESIKKERGMV